MLTLTYKECYMNCKTKEELKEMINKDIKVAVYLNTDRITMIEKAFNEVVAERPELDFTRKKYR